MLKTILLKIWKFILILITSIVNLFKRAKETDIDDETSDDSTDIVLTRIYIDDDINEIYGDIRKEEIENHNLLEQTVEISEKLNELVDNHVTDVKKDDIVDITKKIVAINKINEEIKIVKPTSRNKKIDELLKKDKEVLEKYIEKENIIIEKTNEIIEEVKEVEEKKEEPEEVINPKYEYYVDYIKDTNRLLKKSKDILKEVNDDTRHNKNLDINIYKLEELKELIKEVRKKYYDFKHNRYIYEIENDFNLKQIDEYEIIINSNNIDMYIKKCNLAIEKIKQYKEHQYNKTNITNSQTKIIKDETKELKKEIEKEKKNKKDNDIDGIDIAIAAIEKDIERQKKVVTELEESLNGLPAFEIKSRRLNIFDNLLNNVIKLSMSLMPFKIIKNRKIGMLVTGHMINNNIRTMRNVISNDAHIDYLTLFMQTKKNLDISLQYERIFNDSLYQVSKLKEEYMKHYGYVKNADTIKIFNKLNQLEIVISEELDRIHNVERNISKVKKIGKYKIR